MDRWINSLILPSRGQYYIRAVSLAVHHHLPVLAMAYTDTLNFWATATYNEINFVRWKRNDCKLLVAKHVNVSNVRF